MTSPIITALVLLSLSLTADLKRSRTRSGRGDKDFSDVIKSDSSGLFIWRIEDFSPVPLPEAQYGVFHNADSYIVLLNQIVDGRFHRGPFICDDNVSRLCLNASLVLRHPLLGWE